jgi:hypothetical protein
VLGCQNNQGTTSTMARSATHALHEAGAPSEQTQLVCCNTRGTAREIKVMPATFRGNECMCGFGVAVGPLHAWPSL